METRTQPPTNFLAKGAKSYLDALTAVEAFRREVEKICQGAYDRHEKRLLAVMGIGPDECKRYEHSDDLEDREVELGVCRSAGEGQCFYIYLRWSEAEDGTLEIKAVVCLDLYTKRVRQEILDEIQQKNPGRCVIKKDIGVGYNLALDTPVTVSEPTSVSQTLDDLISEWVHYCDSIGGLRLKERQAEGRG